MIYNRDGIVRTEAQMRRSYNSYLSSASRKYFYYVTLYDKNGFFALGEVKEFPDGLAIKPIKQFRI